MGHSDKIYVCLLDSIARFGRIIIYFTAIPGEMELYQPRPRAREIDAIKAWSLDCKSLAARAAMRLPEPATKRGRKARGK
jgi:hypothetical protein